MTVHMNDCFRRLAATLAMLLACAGFSTSGGAAEPRLGAADFAKVVPGKSKDDVRAMLGAPARTYPARGAQAESWEYPYRGHFERRSFWVEFTPSGAVSGTHDTKDFSAGYYRGS